MTETEPDRETKQLAEVLVDAVFARLRGLNFQISPRADSNIRTREACIDDVAALLANRILV